MASSFWSGVFRRPCRRRWFEGGDGGAFAAAALEHVEFSFDGELEILHVLVVFFELLADGEGEFFVGLGQGCRPGGRKFERGADAGDNVFALGVDEVIAVEGVFAGVGGHG